MLPAPGEDLRDYRDRMIPLAQIALAPHRARVARSLEDFVGAANLDQRQHAELDAATKETAHKANRRFVGSLHDDQRALLSQHPFDFGDYLLFSTRWEDAISGL